MCNAPIRYFPYDHFCLKDYENIEDGSVVWVDQEFILDFAIHILPQIKCRFRLVTNNRDSSIPYDYYKYPEIQDLANDPRLIHWFTQNYHPNFPSDKISPIPIGLNFHSMTQSDFFGESKATVLEQEKVLGEVLATLKPTFQRSPRIYADFHLGDSLSQSHLEGYYNETRTSIAEGLRDKSFIDFLEQPIARRELWKKKGVYAFSISPFGAGMDCHRTWEDLVLGMIVIVRTSPMDKLYEGLPVVIVNHWSDITEENLMKWFSQYSDAFTNPVYRLKLTNVYWFTKILNTG